AIVIRHQASGAPLQASRWVDAQVVNAGDGMHEHPTQALLDAFTMRRHFRSDRARGAHGDGAQGDEAHGDSDFAGRRVVIVGDLTHSRVVRSNVLLLTSLGAEVTLVAPPTLLPSGVSSWPVTVETDLDAVLPHADVMMMLRVQRERMNGGYFPTPREYTVAYGLTRDRLARLADHAVICHPGPMNRGLEISADAADSAASRILDQVAAGVAVRMSVLYHLLGGSDEFDTSTTAGAARSAHRCPTRRSPLRSSPTSRWPMAAAPTSTSTTGSSPTRAPPIGTRSGWTGRDCAPCRVWSTSTPTCG